ncbi:putative vacuolar protein sorting-associated protein 16 [Spathaspora sp. JA1]|nr:putative vacuolar protein sorting-associated protein 16 [Spathaspora sp. JA1]
MSSNPNFNWSKLQNVYYNIRTCYDTLNWSIDNLYYNYILALSENATLIAIASKFVPHPNLIEIYSTSGNKIWSVVFNSSPNEYIQSFHFAGEDLVVVLNNGVYRYYYDFMGNFNEYNYLKDLTSLDGVGTSGAREVKPTVITNLENNEVEEIHKILEVKIWKSYLVIRMDIKFIICDLTNHVNFEIPLQLPDITTFNFQPSSDTSLIIHAPCKQTIFTIKVDFGLMNYEFIDQNLTDGPFTDISISSNGQLIALFNTSLKKIFVINNKFDKVLLEYDTINESSVPFQIEWCGNDAIVLTFKDEVKLIGPGQQSISFFYDIIEENDEFDLDMLINSQQQQELTFTIPILQSTIDGLRIITTNKVQFLSRVSETSVQMYQIGSVHPSSILVDCIDKFSSNSAKADANISILKHDRTLLTAMTECLKVALDEFDHSAQKRALRAVSFGKIYYDGEEEYYNSDEYLTVLNSIQVLNQIRSPEIGLFLTYDEIKNLGWKLIIEMLLKRNEHYLTLKVIERLQLDNLKELVYIHWCCYKIKKDLDSSDLDLFKIITEKLISLNPEKRINYISISEISEVAHEEGRNSLCKLLVSLEPSVINKIQQLLKFEEVELALIKSFQCGDYDLAKLILLYLQDTLSISQFFRVLNQNESIIQDEGETELHNLNVKISSTMNVTGEVIGHMWVESIGKHTPSLLERYYKQESNNNELNNLKLKSITSLTSEGEEYYETVKSVLLHKSMNRSLNKRTSKALTKELAILELQKKLSDTYMTNFYSEKSIICILVKLIKLNQLKPASKIVHDFNISQEKYWYLVLKTYSEIKDFDRLYEFAFGSLDSTVAKSPIGFEPFMEMGFKYQAPKSHISAYIKNSQKLKYAEKAENFAKNEDYQSAGLEAFRMKDVELLRGLLESIPSSNQPGRRVIQEYIENLGY